MSGTASALAAGYRAALTGAGARLAAVLAIALVATGGLAAHRYLTLKQELTDSALARRGAISALAATTLTEKFERLVDVGISLATRVRFQELVGAGRWSEAAHILQRVPGDFEIVERLFIADPAGILRADVPELPGVIGVDFSHRDWFKGVSKEWKPYISPVYRRAAAPVRNVIAVSVPIRDATRKVVGILVLQVDLERFFEWAQRIDLGPEGRVLVLDGNWHPGFDSNRKASDSAREPATDPLMRQLATRPPGTQVLHDGPDGSEMVLGFAPATYGWSIATLQPSGVTFFARDTL
ncbi:MAG: cache domain-containing protein, partial [Terriglobia bacterium]